MHMSQVDQLRWGILATGRIAATFAKALGASKTGSAVAVASREASKAAEFANAHGIPKSYGSYDELIADPSVEAVYIATPHSQHLEWTLAAIHAGKHVLCEKPLTLNLTETRKAVSAARAKGMVLMEAYMYRCHPQTRRVLDLIRAGTIGRVGLVHATFGFDAPFSPGHRLWNRDLGGGGILDVGGYPVSWARLVAGAMEGRDFLDPSDVRGSVRFHPETGIDVYAAAHLTFPNGLSAQVSCGIDLRQENSVRIYGSEGWLWIPSPYVTARDLEPTRILHFRPGVTEPEEIVITPDRPLYTYEADVFAEAVISGKTEVSVMSLDDSLGNAATLDRWLDGTRLP